MTDTKFKKISQRKLSILEKVVQTNRDWVLSIPGVVSFGVGYKTVDGKRTNTVGLLVYVQDKHDVKKRFRIPPCIEGVPTDVVEAPQMERSPVVESENQLPVPESPVTRGSGPVPPADQGPKPIPENCSGENDSGQPATRGEYKTILGPRIANVRHEPLMGGVPIHNPHTGHDRVGVLGAVVYDKSNDKPLGLSVAHAIGNQTGNQFDRGKKAQVGDPINQPPTPTGSENEIGRLLKFDVDYDAALFQINDRRKVEPKLKGESESFEVNEPIKPRVGMKVECPSRLTFAKGVITAVMTKTINQQSKGKPKYVDIVYIKFDKTSEKTRGGDSGAVWVEVESKRPVGLHRGLQGWRFANGEQDYVAFATSMVQLTRWYPFRFSPSHAATLGPQLRDYQTSLVQLNSEFIAFCHKPDDHSVWIKKFDLKGKKLGEKKTDLICKSGIAAAKLGGSVYAVWQGKGKKIRLAQLHKSEWNLGNPLAFSFTTAYPPSLVNFQSQLVMAYTDPQRHRINILHSRDGRNWYPFEIWNARSQLGPSLLALKNKIVLCWVDTSNQCLMTADLHQSGKSFNVYNRNKLSQFRSTSCPAMAGGPGKAYLAFCSDEANQVILEKSNKTQWKVYSTKPVSGPTPTSLVTVDDEPLFV